jgi:hypothetical protein
VSRALFAVVSVLVSPLAASAHGLSLDVKVSGSAVSIAVYYDDDTPGAGAAVKVYDAGKAVVLEGTTDAKGEWTFPAPPPGEYTVRAKTDDGHATKYTPFAIADVPPPADAPPGESSANRPPRLLVLGIGVLALTVGFNVWYWLSRRKRTAGPSNV